MIAWLLVGAHGLVVALAVVLLLTPWMAFRSERSL